MRLTCDSCTFRVHQVIRPILVLAANGSWVGEEDIGGTSLVFAIEPCLPPGLWLDSVSGMIFGKPQQTVAHGTIFTLTASNALGSTSMQLTMVRNIEEMRPPGEGEGNKDEYVYTSRPVPPTGLAKNNTPKGLRSSVLFKGIKH